MNEMKLNACKTTIFRNVAQCVVGFSLSFEEVLLQFFASSAHHVAFQKVTPHFSSNDNSKVVACTLTLLADVLRLLWVH